MLFRRFSADLTPVLKYVVNQLYAGKTSEIAVLRELIWKMAGIEPLPSLSSSQIAAMAGGPTLRIQAIAADQRGATADPGDLTMRGPQRLGKALVDSGYALPLLIQVAQQRQACLFATKDAPLKSLAGLFDAVCLPLAAFLVSPTYCHLAPHRLMAFCFNTSTSSHLLPSSLLKTTPKRFSHLLRTWARNTASLPPFACRLFGLYYMPNCSFVPFPSNFAISS